MRADFKDIKVIVVDIDGTLTDMSRHINLEAVRELRQLPIPVVLSSGNVICFVRAAAKLLGASDMMIGENGGVVQAGYDAKPIVLADIEAVPPGPRRAAERVPRAWSRWTRPTASPSSLSAGTSTSRRQSASWHEHFPELEIVDTQFALHLKHRDVNKATGLRKIAEIMGIESRNVAAMGDSENDLPMLKEAGLAIAVGNAAPELKAVADYVSKASYGDGAAEAFAWLRSKLQTDRSS